MLVHIYKNNLDHLLNAQNICFFITFATKEIKN